MPCLGLRCDDLLNLATSSVKHILVELPFSEAAYQQYSEPTISTLASIERTLTLRRSLHHLYRS
jgi:hypothetical protein